MILFVLCLIEMSFKANVKLYALKVCVFSFGIDVPNENII
jgi:hypothetical protein